MYNIKRLKSDVFSVGFAGQEMSLEYYYQYCPYTPAGLYARGHAETAFVLNKEGEPAK